MLKKPTNKDLLKEVLNQKVSYSDKFLTVKYKKSANSGAKNFIVVPSAVSKKAVIRNKIKRRSRVILSKIDKLSAVNMAVFFKKGSEGLSFEELKGKLSEAVKNIK